MELVPHFFLFRLQIFEVDFVWLNNDRHCFNDSDAVSGEPDPFCRIVGYESDFCCVQVAEYLCANAVFALVSAETEFKVRLNGVASQFLQMIGFQFVY